MGSCLLAWYCAIEFIRLGCCMLALLFVVLWDHPCVHCPARYEGGRMVCTFVPSGCMSFAVACAHGTLRMTRFSFNGAPCPVEQRYGCQQHG